MDRLSKRLRLGSNPTAECIDLVSLFGDNVDPPVEESPSTSSTPVRPRLAPPAPILRPGPAERVVPPMPPNHENVDNLAKNLEALNIKVDEENAEILQQVNMLHSELIDSKTEFTNEIETIKKDQNELKEALEKASLAAQGIREMNDVLTNLNNRILQLEQKQEEMANQILRMGQGQPNLQNDNRNVEEEASTSRLAANLKCFEPNCYLTFGTDTLRDAHTEAAHCYKVLQNGIIKCCFHGKECGEIYPDKNKFLKHFKTRHATPQQQN
ncbi:unnamed protein product [Orchesella dallaii]|uniref:C2H2-type domain-containing protein n=1 Tax=Orchesella dallaii TaxID=48710 RepID=A0ABP1RN03_9HEXA